MHGYTYVKFVFFHLFMQIFCMFDRYPVGVRKWTRSFDVRCSAQEGVYRSKIVRCLPPLLYSQQLGMAWLCFSGLCFVFDDWQKYKLFLFSLSFLFFCFLFLLFPLWLFSTQKCSFWHHLCVKACVWECGCVHHFMSLYFVSACVHACMSVCVWERERDVRSGRFQLFVDGFLLGTRHSHDSIISWCLLLFVWKQPYRCTVSKIEVTVSFDFLFLWYMVSDVSEWISTLDSWWKAIEKWSTFVSIYSSMSERLCVRGNVQHMHTARALRLVSVHKHTCI